MDEKIGGSVAENIETTIEVENIDKLKKLTKKAATQSSQLNETITEINRLKLKIHISK